MLIGRKLRGFQFGLESTQGTMVAATTYIPNGTFRNRRQNNTRKGDAEGHRSAFGIQRGKRWSEWSLTGQTGYNILNYIQAGIYDKNIAVSSPNAGVYTRNAQDIQTALHDPQTFTFEYGNSLGSNSKFAFGTMTDFTLRVSESACDYEIGGVGNYPTKNIAMSSITKSVPAILTSFIDYRVSWAPTFSGLSSGKELTFKSIEFNVKTKYVAQFFIDDATLSIGGILETKPDMTGSLTVAEGTESDQFLGVLEAGTVSYIQLRATGPSLVTNGGTTYYNSHILTWAIYIESEEETDDNDLFAGKYNFYAAEDVVNGDTNLSVTTGMATL